MELMFGQHDHALDAKGRIILPAKFRPYFAEGGYLSKQAGGCLALRPPDTFQRHMAMLEQQQDQGPRQRNMARVLSAGTERVEVDRQGRLPIAAHLRQYAKLESAVLVNGAIDRVELWDPAQWAATTAEAEQWMLEDRDVNQPALAPD